jgi:hypothetical protein
MPRTAPWTGLASVLFAYQLSLDANRLCFVTDLPSQPSMRPITDLLLRYTMEPLLVCHLPHIPNRQSTDLTINSPIHYGTRDLVLNVVGSIVLIE